VVLGWDTGELVLLLKSSDLCHPHMTQFWIRSSARSSTCDHLIAPAISLMPNEEEKMSFDVWCDLLEKELKTALEDLAKIRKADSLDHATLETNSG
jgi:hypothetical protein